MFARSFFYLQKLKRDLHLEPSKLQQLQLEKLKKILKYSYENVPFYHKKFDKAKVRPDDIRSIDDLSKIPVTTKQEIQSSSLEDIVAKNVDLDKCVRKTTSGSTGMPLTLFVDMKTVDFEEALLARAYLENGLKFRDKMAVISDPRGFPKRKGLLLRLGILRRHYVSIFDDVESQLRVLGNYRPDVVKSYSSSITLLVDVCRNVEHVLRPRLVFTSAEVLDDRSRKLIQSVFGSELFDNYACYEFGLLGWECGKHEGYHMNVDSVVMEFLKDGGTVGAGERGEIVCTSLSNFVMPLIRYRTCDIGVPLEDLCSCDVTLPLMRIVEGRADDFLVTIDGKIVPPTVFFPYPFEEEDFAKISQFRIVQEKRDKLVFHIAIKNSFGENDKVLERAEKRIYELFGEAMRVEFQIVNELRRDTSGKLRKVISRVPIKISQD